MTSPEGQAPVSEDTEVRQFLPLRPPLFHLLLGLSQGVSHGYALKLAAEERTEGVVRMGPGTLYESLQRLEKRDLIEEADAPPEAEGERTDRRYYKITPLGQAVIEAELRQLARVLAEAREARVFVPVEV